MEPARQRLKVTDKVRLYPNAAGLYLICLPDITASSGENTRSHQGPGPVSKAASKAAGAAGSSKHCLGHSLDFLLRSLPRCSGFTQNASWVIYLCSH